MVSRRMFLRHGVAMAGLGACPSSLTTRMARASRHKRLVVIHLRGGADGLNIVVPYRDAAYYRNRPTTALPPPGREGAAIDLDGFFGFHPALQPLKSLYDRRQLAVIHACGSRNAVRAHCEAQAVVESHIDALKTACEARWPAALVASTGRSTPPVDGAMNYPSSPFGRSLVELARLMKEEVAPRIAVAESLNWDHHANQGRADGPLARRLADLASGLTTFVEDMGPLMNRTVVVILSEFGRTLAENDSRGTDHGHGNAVLVIGAGVNGGRVYGRWPGLARDQLFEGRDLQVTTDVRDVLAEVVSRHLGGADPAPIFRGYHIEPRNRPHFMA